MMPRHPKTPRILRAALLCLCLVVSGTPFLFMGNAQVSRASQVARIASPNGLLINEAFDSQTPANEYFEMFNTSNVSINLSTYTIYNRDGNTPLSGLDNPVIGPNEYRGIGPTQLHTATIGGPTGLSQNDFLGLVNTSPSDAIIDVVNWGGSPNLGWPNYEKFRTEFFTSNIPTIPPADDVLSLQRWPDGLDSDTGKDFAQIQRSPNAPSCADPNEGRTNDDSLANAIVQELSTTVLHRLCPAGDRDFISLNLTTNFTYTLKTIIPSGSQANTILRLYSPDNVVVAEDTDTTTRDSFIRFRPTSSGTFKAQVTDVNGGGAAGPVWLYSFRAEAESGATSTPTPPAVTNCLDQYEPDDQLAQAPSITLNSEQTHTLCHPDGTRDTDWVAVQVSAGKVYTFLTKNLSSPVDTIISLHSADGTKLFENDDYDPGQGLASRIDYNFSQGGLYYLRIRNKTDATGVGYQYTVAFASSGQLPATATGTASATANPNTPTPTAAPCVDAYEPDGVAATARLFYIGSTQKHSICPATDADWVRFYARAGKVYTIRTANLGVGLDTYMYLFDSDGSTILAQNDDGGDGVASRIDFYPKRDDYYFAQVKNAGDIGGPDQTYDLILTVAAGVPQPASTATFIGAPAVTVTSGSQPPTVVIQPTRPPLPSPTQGTILPTPLVANVTAVASPPGPQPSQQPTIGRVAPVPTLTTQPAVTPVSPTEVRVPIEVPPTAVGSTEAAPSPTAQVIIVPNVPRTGELDPARQEQARGPQVIVLPTRVAAIKAPEIMVKPPVVEQPGTNLAPMLFRLFYDRNRNDQFDTGEGVRGINVYFVPTDATNVALGALTTTENGSGKVMLPDKEQRIYIPYLGINMPLARFPDRELHSLWLPSTQLPTRIP